MSIDCGLWRIEAIRNYNFCKGFRLSRVKIIESLVIRLRSLNNFRTSKFKNDKRSASLCVCTKKLLFKLIDRLMTRTARRKTGTMFILTVLFGSEIHCSKEYVKGINSCSERMCIGVSRYYFVEVWLVTA